MSSRQLPAASLRPPSGTHPPATVGPRFVFGGITFDDVSLYEPVPLWVPDQAERVGPVRQSADTVRTPVRTNHCLLGTDSTRNLRVNRNDVRVVDPQLDEGSGQVPARTRWPDRSTSVDLVFRAAQAANPTGPGMLVVRPASPTRLR